MYLREIRRDLSGHLPVQLGMNELERSVHRDKQIGLALAGVNLADIDMQVTDR